MALPDSTAVGTTVQRGGTVVSTGIILQTPNDFFFAGSASGTFVGQGDTLWVLPHGTDTSNTVGSGGTEEVLSGGRPSAPR